MISSLVSSLMLVSATMASDMLNEAVAPLYRRQAGTGNSACLGFYSAESSCVAKTAGFTNLAFSQQASCLCYQGTSYAPSVYDGYVSTCLSYLATASPSFYSTELGGTDFPTAPCALVAATPSQTAASATGSQGQTASITAAPSATGSMDPNAASCTSWDMLAQECSQETPGFSALPFKSEASCLCYVGTSYAPQIYDGYWQGCLSFFQTANASLYSEIQSEGVVTTPCQAAGNVRYGNTTASQTTSSRRTSSVSVLTTQGSATATQTSAASSHGSKLWVALVVSVILSAFY